jgi:DNA-directed RNA polymerase subunit beta'
VQDNDFVKAGTPLSDGSISPADILKIKGPYAVQEYMVNEIQEVYRLQGVKINDKHIEVIVRQMMRKVYVVDPGDTRFLEDEAVDRFEVLEENEKMYDKKVVTEAGDSATLKVGQIVTLRQIREENSNLKRNDKKLVQFRDAHPATSAPLLMGITKASINASTDNLLGLKENVIIGHLIPAGTGLPVFENQVVGSKEEYQRLMESKRELELAMQQLDDED